MDTSNQPVRTKDSPTCPPGTIGAPQPDGTIVCSGTVDVRCAEPLELMCKARFDGTPTCQCEMPPPAMCAATITYQATNPSAVSMSGPSPGCDGAGAELAIAVLLAKLLGMLR